MTIKITPPAGPRDIFVAHERRIDDTERALQFRGQTASVTGASTGAFVTSATSLSVAASTDETFAFTLAGVLSAPQTSQDYVPVLKPRLYQIDCIFKTVGVAPDYFDVRVNGNAIFSFTIPSGAKTYSATAPSGTIALLHLGVDFVAVVCVASDGTGADLVATARFGA